MSIAKRSRNDHKFITYAYTLFQDENNYFSLSFSFLFSFGWVSFLLKDVIDLTCFQVGAPPEVVARLEEACASEETMGGGRSGTSCIGEDPALDQFMEAYCEMLTKYEQELTKPFKEAMLFLSRIECQFKALTVNAPSDSGHHSLSL